MLYDDFIATYFDFIEFFKRKIGLNITRCHGTCGC